MTAKPIKCRDCEVPAEITADSNGHGTVSCPSCGVEEDYKNVLRGIAEQGEYFAAKKLQDSMKRVARGSKIMSYEGTNLKNPIAQFIIDFER